MPSKMKYIAMKRIFIILFILFWHLASYSQTVIAIQSFETSGDTWAPLNFSTPPCETGNDVWNYTTSLPGIRPNDGNQFWGIRDLDGSCGGNGFETITLPNISVATFSNVVFSFDYNAISFDNNDDLKYELFFDNISQGEVVVVNGVNNNSDNTNGWVTETVTIPNTVINVSLILSARNNSNNDRGGFDNVKLAEASIDQCAGATALTVGSTNTENVITGTNIGASSSIELPLPSCGNYLGRDVWYTAQVPNSGMITIETQSAGSNIDTAIAVYSGQCGNLTELACNDDIDWPSNSYSQVNLTGIPNTIIYIRVYAYNNDSAGNFNIVAYSPECPFTTTWNGGRWSNGTPNSATSAVINGNYDTAKSGSFESCHCTVNTRGTLNISANNYVSVENDLTVNGTLEVLHEGSLVMVEDDGIVTSSGTINIHKTSTPTNKYDYIYWSSPTANETIGSALATSEANRIYSYHHENGWASANGATTMQPAIGYIAMTPIAGTFPQKQSVVFDGLVNTGVIQTSIEKSTNTEQADLDWHLIGNPYPSALDAKAFLDDPLNTSIVNGTIYLWTHNTAISKSNAGNNSYNYSSNDYASFTSGTGGVAAISGSEIPNGFIASGQGFFLEAATSGNLTFNNGMRAKTNNTQFFKKVPSELVEKDRIWLNLFNEKGAFSQLLIGFIDGATDGIDRSYDGPKFGGNYISFYSIIEDKNFAIQGKDAIEDEEHIKLGLFTNITQGDSLKISINKVEGAIADYNVYLKDSYKNTLHDLTMEDYLFIPEEQGTFDNRFELILSRSKVLSVTETDIENENLILINRNQSIDISTSKKSTITHLRAYDILGKSIFSMNPNKSNSSINTQNIAKGTVLLINARLENNQSISKKVIIL
tara:strand:- start:164675 stop:167311 length:2637 start_codon:yes stop_codon:yes gene_type:complete